MTKRKPASRRRNIPIHFMVSAKEKALIDKAMKTAGARSKREYLTGMALGGYIIRVNTKPFRQTLTLLRKVSDSTNQIARRVNETRNIYAEDIEELQRDYEAIRAGIGEAIAALELK